MRLTVPTLLASLLVTSTAQAHMGSTKYLVVHGGDEGARVDVRVEDIDVALALGLGTSLDASDVRAHEALISGWLARGISIRSDDGACAATPSGLSLVTADHRPFVEATITYRCEAEGELRLTDDTVFGQDSRHETLVRVEDRGETSSHVLRDGTRSIVVRGAMPSMWSTGLEFVLEGAHHLAIGYDHLLFLLSLLLAAAAVARKNTTKRAMIDATKLVTAFTIGHSITLVIASLGILTFPSRLVESAIALSVVIAAGMNVARPEDEKARPWLALAFGLIHGFGFSSVLAELGLPSGHRFVALASFNVGIELAQLGFVVTLLPLLAMLAKKPAYTRLVLRGGSVAIALCGGFWFVERALEL